MEPNDCPSPPAGPAAAFFPGIVTNRFVATCEFYFEHFGFRPAVVEQDYMVLTGPQGARLGIMRAGNASQPAALQVGTRGTGLWLQWEVDDPDAVHARLTAAGVEVVSPPAFTLAATRRFVVRDPAGVLIFISDRTPATPLPVPLRDAGPSRPLTSSLP